MRRLLWVPLTAALLTACDLDFIAVDAVRQGAVMLRTHQRSTFEASVLLSLPGEDSPPAVRLGGAALPGARDGGQWQFQDHVVVDSLQTQLELVIQGSDLLVLSLPLLTRSGPAAWRPNGDLELPLSFGDGGIRADSLWEVALLDSIGLPLGGINSQSAQLPSALVLPGQLVSARAVAAEVSVRLHRQIDEGPYPLTLFVIGSVRFPLPASH